MVTLLGLVRLWLGFGFGFCLLCFSLLTLAVPSDSANVFLCFCLHFPLFLLAFLLASACISPWFSACVLRRSSLFLLVFLLVHACVSPGLCLCCSLFLRVFPSASARGFRCFCVCACFPCLNLLVFVALLFAHRLVDFGWVA